MKDLYNNLEIIKVLDPVSRGDGNSGNKEDIDLAGANSATLAWYVGACATATDDNYWQIKLEHADDDGTGSAGTYTAVAAKDVLGVTPHADGWVFYMKDHTTGASKISTVGYVGGKRFLKVSWDEQGTGPTSVFALFVIKGNLRDVPVIS